MTKLKITLMMAATTLFLAACDNNMGEGIEGFFF